MIQRIQMFGAFMFVAFASSNYTQAAASPVDWWSIAVGTLQLVVAASMWPANEGSISEGADRPAVPGEGTETT